MEGTRGHAGDLLRDGSAEVIRRRHTTTSGLRHAEVGFGFGSGQSARPSGKRSQPFAGVIFELQALRLRAAARPSEAAGLGEEGGDAGD